MPASQPVDYVKWLQSFGPGASNSFWDIRNALLADLTALRAAVQEARKFLDIDTREPGATWPVVPDMMRHRAALVALYRAADLLTHTNPRDAHG